MYWRLVVPTLCLLATPVAGQARSATAPSAAQAIDDALVVARIADDRGVVADLARSLAAEHGRDAVEPLADLLTREGDAGYDKFLAVHALAKIADPEDRQGLLTAANREAWRDLGIGVAAVASPRDDAARHVLLDLVDRSARGKDTRGRVSYYACGFLRSHDPAVVRPRVEAALAAAEGPPREHLLALLESFDYRSSLADPADRAAYIEFEDRFWRAWSVTRKGSRAMFADYDRAAQAIAGPERWGDGRFVRRVLATAVCDGDEKRVAMSLAAYLRVVGARTELRAIADLGSAEAAYALNALGRLDLQDPTSGRTGK